VCAIAWHLAVALHQAARMMRIAPLVLLAGCVSSPVIESQSSPIIGGSRTAGDPAVVLLVISFDSGYSMCTAEIVSPHVVMTAAHCVDPAETGPVKRFDIFLGDDLDDPQLSADPKMWLKVKSTHHDPKFDGQRLGDGHDVAVVILDQPTTIAPLPLNRTPLTQASMGQMLRLVGYGVTNGWTQQGSGRKRQTSTPLSDYDQTFITFGNAQKGTCQGDSGGPAFMVIGGVEQIVGVTSFGDQGCQQGGWDTRVDTIGVPFVDPFIAMHDPAGGSGGGAGGTPPRLSPDPGQLGHSDVTDAVPAQPRPGAHDPAACDTGGCDLAPRAHHGWTGYFLGLLLLILSRRRRARMPPRSDASIFF
jgi:V8-like Glu-specific endopeptidase